MKCERENQISANQDYSSIVIEVISVDETKCSWNLLFMFPGVLSR